ncbi:MAG: hypothetical protein IT287_06215 [Bdellovibrionaceae bacterium]|nr:hypothetical protein [Pseudobdellovibrionaceae bacterium]
MMRKTIIAVASVLTALILIDFCLLKLSSEYKAWFLERGPGESISYQIIGFDQYSYHPYLGYYDKVEMERPPEAGKFRIAILGGSFADQMYHVLRKQYRSELAAVFGKKVEDVQIFNFAAAGYAQPIQLLESVLYGDDIHVFISMEGYNEMFTSHYTCLPEEWPREILRWPLVARSWFWYLGSFAKNISQKIYSATHSKSIAASLARPIYYLSSAPTLSLLQKLSSMHIETVSAAVCTAHTLKEEERLHLRIANWMKSLRKLERVQKSLGKEFYVFFQPNLHFKNSKPLSVEELALQRLEHRSAQVDAGYISARAEFVRLDPLHYIDVTDVYINNSETLYTDSCCHVNKRGNEFVLERLIWELKKRVREH